MALCPNSTIVVVKNTMCKQDEKTNQNKVKKNKWKCNGGRNNFDVMNLACKLNMQVQKIYLYLRNK
jgi:hypothetical protein